MSLVLQMELCTATALNRNLDSTSQMKLIMNLYSLVSLSVNGPLSTFSHNNACSSLSC